jgi:hypothetical protein
MSVNNECYSGGDLRFELPYLCFSGDAEIIILGCGAYGFPLASKLKAAGKQVIHLGGATQLLFGIKGKRWDNNPPTAALYNEYWTRPAPQEYPPGALKVEGGCYW